MIREEGVGFGPSRPPGRRPTYAPPAPRPRPTAPRAPRKLTGLLEGIDITRVGAEVVGEFTAEHFDRCRARPELPRLLAWESHEMDQALERRRPICAGQVECFRTAVPGLDRGERRAPAGHGVLVIGEGE